MIVIIVLGARNVEKAICCGKLSLSGDYISAGVPGIGIGIVPQTPVTRLGRSLLLREHSERLIALKRRERD